MLADPDDPPSKRAVVDAALRLFVRDGFRETTIRAIAQESGYTNPALFKFFATKDDLGAYVFARCHARVVARLAPRLQDDGPLDDVLRRWVGAYLDLVADERDVVLFVHEHAATFWPRMQPAGDRDGPFAALVRWLRRARRDGRVSTAVDANVQALVVVGAFHQLARHGARPRVADDVARILAGALRA